MPFAMNALSSLRDIALFVEVARQQSFSVASQRLNMPRATLSRRIASMERDLGVQLLKRTTRHVELTTVGLRYFERCCKLVDEARMAQEALRGEDTAHVGHIHLTMPVDLGVTVIGPLLPLFAQRYPDITLKLDLSPRNTDLMREGVDLGIRLGAPLDDRLVTRQLGLITMGLFASKAYLDQHGRPQSPTELSAHPFLLPRVHVGLTRIQLTQGELTQDVEVSAPYCANNVGLLRVLAERHMGIANLPVTICSKAVPLPSLERVLPKWFAASVPIHAVSSSRLRSTAVRVFLAFLEEALGCKA